MFVCMIEYKLSWNLYRKVRKTRLIYLRLFIKKKKLRRNEKEEEEE